MFHAYLLYHRVLPSGLTRKGPCSVIAPLPIDEQPGPAVPRMLEIAKRKRIHIHTLDDSLETS